ncbi:hypothetical protein EV363DRAFT_1307967 [Boletus edulis]|nr:hypothetical protein EV363DRAFT_1307967 [Boletus edulis]
MRSAEQVLSLHVYRIGGFLGDDRIIKAQDKITDMRGAEVTTQWQFTLHADGPNGAIICRVSSGYIGPPLICDVSPGSILRRPFHLERRRGTPEGTRWFRGPDDKDYHWRFSTHLWRDDMQCLNAEGEIMATYRATAMAISKDGEASGQFMINLLVATSLAMRTPNH